MVRNKVDLFLGKKVEIELFDGSIEKGIFYKTGDIKFKNYPSNWLLSNYYFVDTKINRFIRSSHIKKIKECV